MGRWIFIILAFGWIIYLWRREAQQSKKIVKLWKEETVLFQQIIRKSQESSLNQQIQGTQSLLNLQGTIVQLCKEKLQLYQSHNYLQDQKADLAIHLEILEGMVQDVVERDVTLRAAIVKLVPCNGTQRKILQEMLDLFPD